jgi:hypothetical protein
MEMVDTYGILILAFLFISGTIYFRNTLFRLFTYYIQKSKKNLTNFSNEDQTKSNVNSNKHNHKFINLIPNTYSFLKNHLGNFSDKVKKFFKK